MKFETDRLTIREFSLNDEADIHEYGCDPEVVEHMIWGPNSLADTQEALFRMIKFQEESPRVNFEFAIVLKASGKVIGGCGLRLGNAIDKVGDIGYVLNRKFWGQGIMTEAVALLLRFGFEDLGLHRITAMTRPKNLGSQRVLTKSGFRHEGTFLENKFYKNKFNDSAYYAILKSEWKNAKV